MSNILRPRICEYAESMRWVLDFGCKDPETTFTLARIAANVVTYSNRDVLGAIRKDPRYEQRSNIMTIEDWHIGKRMRFNAVFCFDSLSGMSDEVASMSLFDFKYISENLLLTTSPSMKSGTSVIDLVSKEWKMVYDSNEDSNGGLHEYFFVHP